MLTDACFKFALESLKKCIKIDPNSNVFFSPHLLYQNLLVIYFGIDDKTEEDTSLRRTLCIPDDISKAVVEQHFFFGGSKQFCYVENGPKDSYMCRIYSRLFIEQSKGIYLDTTNLFSSGHQVKEINFRAHPERARNFINNSISCVTQRCMANLLPADTIDSNTEVTLLNAMYCKGQLDCDCAIDINNHKNTKRGMFDIINNMEQFRSGDAKKKYAYIIEAPCKEKKISTFFFFPSYQWIKNSFTEGELFLELIEYMISEEGSQKLRELLDNGLAQQNVTAFPAFKIEHDLNIFHLLDMMGLEELTPLGSTELEDFSSRSLKLGNAVHRVSIDLTTSNITAAATNVFLTDNCSDRVWKDTTPVEVTFPCLCLVYDRSRRNILFCGVLPKNRYGESKR